MKKGKIYFRADGNSEIGLGHVIRSLALAEMLVEKFDCHFLIKSPLPSIKEQILAVCTTCIELPDEEDFVKEAENISLNYIDEHSIVVLDGYNFKTAYQQIIKAKGVKLVCIDDIHSYHFVADVIINHAGGISKSDYSTVEHTQFCLSTQYALLRTPFQETAKNRNYSNQEKGSIFICLGGADPNNTTIEVLKKCEQISKDGKCYLVLGAAYLHRNEISNFIVKSPLKVTLLNNLNAEEMVKYMQRCEYAITPPSTISYEYLSVGGILYLKKIADNQVDLYNFLTKNKLALDFDTIQTFNKDESLIAAQKKYFNGHTKKRMSRLFSALSMKTRKATVADLLLYYNWANEPSVRRQSYNSASIPLADHTSWFKKSINNENAVLYVIELNETPIGQIRFNIKDKHAQISYTLDVDHRGQGLGEGILRNGIANLKMETKGIKSIFGYVKKNNIPSVKAFRAIGSTQEETTSFDDSYKFTIK